MPEVVPDAVLPRPRRRWQPSGFAVAAGLLTASAVGLNVAVAHLQLAFLKQPVPLAQPLDTVPAKVGHWVQVSKDEPLDHAVQETLGTDVYIFRDYANAQVVPAADLARFDGLEANARKRLVADLQQRYPDAVVSVAVTYYTGKVDTVAHVPERCYMADGWDASASETVDLSLGDSFHGNGGAHTVKASLLTFQDRTDAARSTRQVGYFFLADGEYLPDPVSVRRKLQDLFVKSAFYSKVEFAATIPDRDRCERVMADFLSDLMPDVQRCYPDWNAVVAGNAK